MSEEKQLVREKDPRRRGQLQVGRKGKETC